MTATAPLFAVDAVVFDAYGTLFDVHSVAATAERLVPGRGAALSQLWRTKQLEYTWLQSLMGPAAREDFAAVTAHALDYALAALDAPLTDSDRSALCTGYLTLDPYDDVAAALAAVAPRSRWILSNGTLAMLEPLVRHSGLDELIDGVLSVDAAGVYKPNPRVYQLAVDQLELPRSRIAFVSSNCWDAVGAKSFGFTTFWINRANVPVDRHGPPPDWIIATLSDLPPLLARQHQ